MEDFLIIFYFMFGLGYSFGRRIYDDNFLLFVWVWFMMFIFWPFGLAFDIGRKLSKE